jgi:hypothetical protein
MNKKIIGGIIAPLLLCIGIQTKAQGPGLIISEILPNPSGTDSPFEYVELVATRNIDFSVTPYSVVWSNNGTATTSGWINGGTISYGFSINSGTVTTGQVVYVGGTSMTPTGTKLRVLNTATDPGDGFGTAASGGVLGNGGSNADGVAVFDLPIASLTSSSVPIDALFFGTGFGTAVVNAGADGYELPVNDLYSGGKLQSTSFLAPDPGSAQIISGAGQFNQNTGLFTTNRTWTLASTMTDGTSSVFLTFPPANISFGSAQQQVNENAGSVSVLLTITSPNMYPSSVTVIVHALSNVDGSDYIIANPVVNFPANSTDSQTFPITITNDNSEEQTEYFVLEITNTVNAVVTGTSRHYLYLKDDDRLAPVTTNELAMQLLSTYQNGAEGSNSAEIVAFDETNDRLFVANSIGNKLDILDFSNPASVSNITSVDLSTYGKINSVSVKNGVVALAIENSTTSPQDNGFVVFMDQNGNFLNQVTVGAMPDMITFNHTGTKVITANEGEPNQNYDVDPEGTISVIDISGGVLSVNQSNVTTLSFTSFNGQEATLRAQGIRIFGPGATAAMDFEPEYVTISDDDLFAWVTLQENNAIAKIDLTTNTITNLFPLGLKDHSVIGNGMDVSDQTNAVNIANFPVKGMYMPDAISQMQIAGQTYLFTANEGDAREYTGKPGFTEVYRMSSGSVVLDPTLFPNGTVQKQNLLSGRLNITNKTGDLDNDGDLDEIHSFGSRSFSIWNANTGAQVFDSGDDFEMITSSHPTYSALFNASNSSGAAVSKNRSDDKGPEPEGVTTAMINGHHYAFISLERIGGVMSYNIDDPNNPVFASYFNNRNFATNGPDRGAEGMIFIPASQSPNGNDILILANEVSSTLTIYQVNSCEALSNVSISPASNVSFCAGDNVTLTASVGSGVTYQWLQDGNVISGANSSSYNVTTAGDYALMFINSSQQCVAATAEISVTEVTPLTVTANADFTTICEGENVTLSGSGSTSYSWDNGVNDNVSFMPASTLTYTVTGTDGNGCEDTDQITVTVNNLPNVSANATDVLLCTGEQTTLSGSGADSYEWNHSVSNGVVFTPASTQTYTVTGTDGNGCENTDQITVVVNILPTVIANATDITICEGDQVTLFGTGAQNYTWNNGVTNFLAFTPASTNMYSVIGTDVNGCVDTDQITVTVNSLPNPSITDIGSMLQTGSFVSYQWYINGNGIVGAESQTYDPIADGTYTVAVTDNNGCTNESDPFIFSSVGIYESNNQFKINIAPNPYSVNTTLKIELFEAGDLNIEIYDITGKIISVIEKSNVSPGVRSYSIGSLSQNSGLYFVKVCLNNNISTYRLAELR